MDDLVDLKCKKEKFVLEGVVQSLSAPVYINAESNPKFCFSILSEGKHCVEYVDLSEPDKQYIVPIVCAAFQAKVQIKVFLKVKEPHYVDWVQVPKPPM